MKPFFSILLLGLFLNITACNKDDETPKTEFTINTETQQGFSFETFNTLEYPNTTNANPDFVVLAHVNSNGDVVSPFLSHPTYNNRFQLADEFDNLTEAQEFFDTYEVPSTQQLFPTASNVEPYQVWLVKTNTGGFGKILILETDFGKTGNTTFAEVAFKAGRL